MKKSPERAVEHPQEENPPEKRGWFPLFAVLAAVLLAGAVAGVALSLLFGTRPPGDDSVEAGFARDMAVHHAQAVQMAEIARDRTESEAIRTLVTDIALTQQGQIGQMQGWLAIWDLPAVGPEPAMSWMGHPMEGRMPGMASPEEIEELSELPPEEADIRFLQLMITHHQAALPMAEAALQRTDRPEVERLASAIAASQESELEVMENLLAESEDSHSGGTHDHG